MGLLRIIFWILLIYLIYRFLSNVLSPLIKKANSRNFPGEGEPSIKRPDQSSNKSDNDEGEYIDYHEIKD